MSFIPATPLTALNSLAKGKIEEARRAADVLRGAKTGPTFDNSMSKAALLPLWRGAILRSDEVPYRFETTLPLAVI